MVDDPFVEAINAFDHFFRYRKPLTTNIEMLSFEPLQQPLPQTMLYSISFVEEKSFFGTAGTAVQSAE